eukprot:CAMPEP_0185552774 /NCGR_PEP_ID=MMETSP1381-20130426/35059_1 /TAXON_ID=298111 /ORGANISM="Pavlova sp., Strain CCMP459" /LENGTH=134 /DNA_ID=CAMNT_0028165797 /DNA_START=474 /DNA_END=875 /DNA_ORIENTATION=-
MVDVDCASSCASKLLRVPRLPAMSLTRRRSHMAPDPEAVEAAPPKEKQLETRATKRLSTPRLQSLMDALQPARQARLAQALVQERCWRSHSRAMECSMSTASLVHTARGDMTRLSPIEWAEAVMEITATARAAT